MYVFNTGAYVSMCMCGVCTLYFENRSLNLQNRVCWMASEFKGSACFYLPILKLQIHDLKYFDKFGCVLTQGVTM